MGATTAEPAWRVTRASATGTGHVARNLPCQDASEHAVRGEMCVIAVADGVGSASNSLQGAEAATKAALAFLTAETPEPADADAWRERMRAAGREALHAVQAVAEREEKDLRVFASTLLLVVATDHLIAVLQVGDGAIVALFDGFELRALTAPKKGEFANEVLPLTSRGALDAAQIDVVPRSPRAIAVFTDGLESLALALPSGTPYPRFFLPIFDLAARVSEETLHAEILALFEQRVKKRSDDDLTLVVAVLGAAPAKGEWPPPEAPGPLAKSEAPSPTSLPGTADEGRRRRSKARSPDKVPRERGLVAAIPPFPEPRAALVAPRPPAAPTPGPLTPRPALSLWVGMIVASLVAGFVGIAVGVAYQRGQSAGGPPAHTASAAPAPLPPSSYQTALPPAAPRPAGVLDTCPTPAECEPWLSCVRGQCIQKGHVGEPCEHSDECETALSCRDHMCLTPKGPRLDKNCDDCKAGFCVQNLCRWGRFGAGRECGSDDDCAEPLRCLKKHCMPEEKR